MKIAKFFNHDFKETGDDDDLVSFKLYNARGEMIYCEFPEKYYWWARYKYDEAGRVTEKVCSDGYWWKCEYDSDGKEIGYKCSDDPYEDIENRIRDTENSISNGSYPAGEIRKLILDLANQRVESRKKFKAVQNNS